MDRRHFLKLTGSVSAVAIVGLPNTASAEPISASVAIASSMASLIGMFSKGVNPSDQVILETFNTVRVLHEQNTYISKVLFDLSVDILTLRQGVNSDAIRLSEKEREVDVLAIEGVYQSIADETNASLSQVLSEIDNPVERLERVAQINLDADARYKNAANRMDFEREELFLQSDYCAPAIASAAWINILVRFRIGDEPAAVQQTAIRYLNRLNEALDPQKPDSLRALSDATETEISNLRSALAGRVGLAELQPGEYGAGCVETFARNTYRCDSALRGAERAACEGTPSYGGIPILNEILRNPDRYSPGPGARDIALTRVAKWHRVRFLEDETSRGFQVYSIDYVSLTGVEPAVTDKVMTNQTCSQSFDRLDTALTSMNTAAGELARLVAKHNALITKLGSFHTTLTALEEAQAWLTFFVEEPTDTIPALIQSYGDVSPTAVGISTLRDASMEYEEFLLLDDLTARRTELTRFNAYTASIVGDAVTNVELAFKNAKRGASLRKFVSFLQVVKVFGSLIKAVDDLTSAKPENTAEESNAPKTVDELRTSGVPGSDQVIEANQQPVVEAGVDATSTLSLAFEAIKNTKNSNDLEKILAVERAQTAVERAMKESPASITNEQLSLIEDIVVYSKLTVAEMGDTAADEFARNNKFDLEYALDLLTGGDIASVRTDLLLSFFKPQTLDDGTIFGHSARASLIRRAHRNGEKAISIRAWNNGVAPVSELNIQR